MINNLRPVKGFNDRFDGKLIQQRYVLEKCNQLALLSQFHFCQLPLVEALTTYQKPFDITDLSTQPELFRVLPPHSLKPTPTDLVLRPELTSGLIRAYLANALFCQKPTTLFTHGPCFRFENPQKGRLRQFYQGNLEQLRIQGTDIKQSLVWLANLLKQFQIIDQVRIEINYLTDFKIHQLNHFLNSNLTLIKQLCPACQARYKLKTGNLYRIFDCQTCRKLFTDLKTNTFLQPAEQQIFAQLTTGFKQLFPTTMIKVNPLLVRGLLYYRGLVFEISFQNPALQGAQNTLIAGGSYALQTFFKHSLTETGQGFGFAIGIERLIIALETTGFFDQLSQQFTANRTVLIGYLTPTDGLAAYQLQTELIANNYVTQVVERSTHFTTLLEKALTMKARHLIVFDKNYAMTKQLQYKMLHSKKEQRLPPRQITGETALKLIYEDDL